ncbi:MAG TPA: nucleotide sugar dehydrogenase [Conexibacter sp.]|nr:nucleotide sugar dehydrogenase [Conexibacter sp.]
MSEAHVLEPELEEAPASVAMILEAVPATPAPAAPAARTVLPTVAVVGLGYVGLPTALALHDAGCEVVGIDVSEPRLSAIRDTHVDLPRADVGRLGSALAGERLRLTANPIALAGADAVIICVPTPVDEQLRPDPRALQQACAATVALARPGQTLILTSTSAVGSTRELLLEPLAARGLHAGIDVAVAFAPERVNPGDQSVEQHAVPRVLGGATPDCARRAKEILAPTTENIHTVSSLEAAELTKLYENTFRAVNVAFANEMAALTTHLGLDPVEIVDAAATKPYGFLAHYPGPGVGGHCIPVDPHYLLAPLRAAGVRAPITEIAMAGIAARPGTVARRALDLLDDRNLDPDGALVLIAGMAYKPGVADARESPSLAIAAELERAGVEVAYHDPRVPSVKLPSGRTLRSVPRPDARVFDLVVVTTLHDGTDRDWLASCDHVLDATYRTRLGRRRHLL